MKKSWITLIVNEDGTHKLSMEPRVHIPRDIGYAGRPMVDDNGQMLNPLIEALAESCKENKDLMNVVFNAAASLMAFNPALLIQTLSGLAYNGIDVVAIVQDLPVLDINNLPKN